MSGETDCEAIVICACRKTQVCKWSPDSVRGPSLRQVVRFKIAAAYAFDQQNGLSQLTHWAAQPAALVPQTIVSLLLGEAVSLLQDSLRALNHFSQFKFFSHLNSFQLKLRVFFGEPRYRDRSTHLFTYKTQKRDLGGLVGMWAFVMHVQHTDHSTAADKRHTE